MAQRHPKPFTYCTCVVIAAPQPLALAAPRGPASASDRMARLTECDLFHAPELGLGQFSLPSKDGKAVTNGCYRSLCIPASLMSNILDRLQGRRAFIA